MVRHATPKDIAICFLSNGFSLRVPENSKIDGLQKLKTLSAVSYLGNPFFVLVKVVSS
jgi:hypothetical protein